MSLLLLAGGVPAATTVDVGSVDGATTINGVVSVGAPVPTVIEVGSVDGATPIRGIDVLGVAGSLAVRDDWQVGGQTPNPDYVEGVSIVGPFIPDLSAELWSNDGVFLSPLATQTGLRFQDVLNDFGSGQLSLQLDDPDIALLVPGTEVRCYLFGRLVFTFQIVQPPRIRALTSNEEAGMVKQAAGPGRLQETARARVDPPVALDDPLNPQHRIYSFASNDFPNAGSWGKATALFKASKLDPIRKVRIDYTTVIDGEEDIVESVDVPAPNGWPVPDAMWIWGQPDTTIPGRNFFRKKFSLAAAGTYAVLATADNYFTLYIDGTPILGQSDVRQSWKDYVRVDLDISAGEHTFGCVGVNAPLPGKPAANNPAAILVAVCEIDEDGEVILPALIQTNGTWDALPYPAQTPGWTPGQILIDAIDEAQARGAMPGFSYDFTAENDSNGDPWPFLEGFSTAVGSSIRDILTGLVEQGHIDFRVSPGGKVLQAFNQGSVAVNSGVTYEATGDVDTQELTSQDFVPQGEIINAYLVKWTGGYFEVADAASIAAWGRREGFMSVDAPSESEALHEAEFVLGQAAEPVYSVVVSVDPTSWDRYPMIAFNPGEKVQVAGPDGTLTWYQVQSVSISQTETGRAEVVMELNSRLDVRQREQFELLSSLGRVMVGDTNFRNTRMAFSDPKAIA